MDDLKNKITNILAVVVAIGTAVATALETVPEGSQWYVWVGAGAIAILSWFTGKGKDGKKIE